MNKYLVIIPFYNTEDFLQEAIEGILQQEYSNIHIVLVDDCSTDNSLNVVKYYEHLENITLLKNKTNRGAYYSVNKALEKCKDIDWDFFHFHGSDDVSDIRRFKIINEYLTTHNLDGLKSTFVRFHADTKEMAYENGSPHISTSEGSAFYSKKVFNKLGYFDNSRFSSDTDYWHRIEVLSKVSPELNIKVGSHPTPLIVGYLRTNKSNLTLQIPISNRKDYYRKIQEDINQMVQTKNFYRDKFK